MVNIFPPTIWWRFNFYSSKKLISERDPAAPFFFPLPISPDKDSSIFLSPTAKNNGNFSSHSSWNQSSRVWSYYISSNHCQKEVLEHGQDLGRSCSLFVPQEQNGINLEGTCHLETSSGRNCSKTCYWKKKTTCWHFQMAHLPQIHTFWV